MLLARCTKNVVLNLHHIFRRVRGRSSELQRPTTMDEFDAGLSGRGGFSFQANSPTITNLLNNVTAPKSRASVGRGNMFESTVKRQQRLREAKAAAYISPSCKSDLLSALDKIANGVNGRSGGNPATSSSSSSQNLTNIGIKVSELLKRRANDACLSSAWSSSEANKFSKHVDRFKRLCRDAPHRYTMHNFLKYCARSDTMTVKDVDQQLAILCLLNKLQQTIEFDAAQHVYYEVRPTAEDDACVPTASAISTPAGEQQRNGSNTVGRYELSVTKSLELLFGEFDADGVARRITQSKKWKSNALYKELAFDVTGRQRSESEVIGLLKKRWKDSRDKGTMLHTYIQSLAADEVGGDRLWERRDAMSATTTNCSPMDVQLPSCETTAVFLDQNIATSDDTRNDRRVDHVNQLWSDLRAPETELTRWSASATAPQPSIEAAAAAQIDPVNIEAFERFNRRRIKDGWLLLASEYIVYDRQASLAGSIDAIYVPYPHQPNIVVLVDWKRCEIDLGTRYSPFIPGMRNSNAYSMHYPKCNYWKYAMQLNVYRELLERMTQHKLLVMDMLIVSLPPEMTEPRVYSVPRLSDAQLFVDDISEAVAQAGDKKSPLLGSEAVAQS